MALTSGCCSLGGPSSLQQPLPGSLLLQETAHSANTHFSPPRATHAGCHWALPCLQPAGSAVAVPAPREPLSPLFLLLKEEGRFLLSFPACCSVGHHSCRCFPTTSSTLNLEPTNKALTSSAGNRCSYRLPVRGGRAGLATRTRRVYRGFEHLFKPSLSGGGELSASLSPAEDRHGSREPAGPGAAGPQGALPRRRRSPARPGPARRGWRRPQAPPPAGSSRSLSRCRPALPVCVPREGRAAGPPRRPRWGAWGGDGPPEPPADRPSSAGSAFVM